MNPKDYIELKPIKESTSDFDEVERRLKELFKREIYYPLLKELGETNTLANSSDDLLKAIRSGRIQFYRGTFSGRFNASISKELKRLGAQWDRKSGTFKIPQPFLPSDVRQAALSAESYFQKKVDGIDRKLAQILPEKIAGKVKVSDLFDRTLWKTEKAFQKSVDNITVTPELSKAERKAISDDWQKNMQLWVKDFTKKEIVELRTKVQDAAFTGNRRESLLKTIQESYGVSANKAKFLARQETSLLMTKYKQARYQEAGVNEYIWGCVTGTKNHPVRPSHKKLEGTTHTWDNPPITTEPGEPARRNNPGQDYNCRCFAKPIVRRKKRAE